MTTASHGPSHMRHFLFLLCTLTLLAQGGAAAQQPAVRPLGPVAAAAAESLGAVVTVRPLHAGVLVNDVQHRRLLLFDSALTRFTVVADTTPATAGAYGGRVAGLIAWRDDSTLFVDPASMSMLVIDPAGKVHRVMSVPRAQDAFALGAAGLGTPAFDASGRLVYRGMPRPMMRELRGAGAGLFVPPEIPDSAPLLRIDLASRQVDTVAFTRTPKVKMDVQRDDNGRVNVTAQVNPLPVVDDWAVLSDGSIAIVRGRDYHVDWIRPAGARESSPRVPFDWRRLSDEDKVAFIDSVKAARARMAASAPPGAGIAGGAGGGVLPGAPGGPPGEVRIMIGGGGAGGGPPGGGALAGGGREVAFVAPGELPDYQPPFFVGAARADRAGHLWIGTTPTRALAGGPVYDVIDARGQLVDRVQVAAGRTIAAFGEDGAVYLLAREGNALKLEKARLK